MNCLRKKAGRSGSDRRRYETVVRTTYRGNPKEQKEKIMNMRKSQIVLCAFVVMVTSLGAMGAVAYYDEATFLAAAPFSLDMESFENLPVDNAIDAHTSLTLPDFTLVADDPLLSVWNYTPSWGGHATDGVQYVLAGSTAYQLDFNLNSSVKAFGLNIIDWGDWGSGTLTFSNHGDAQFSIAIAPLPDDNELFFGAISEQEFDRVTISHNITGEAYSIDEVYYGIPEPATLSLLAVGALALIRRRRK